MTMKRSTVVALAGSIALSAVVYSVAPRSADADCQLRCDLITCMDSSTANACYQYEAASAQDVISMNGSTTADRVTDGSAMTRVRSANCDPICAAQGSNDRSATCSGPYGDWNDVPKFICVEPTPPGGT